MSIAGSSLFAAMLKAGDKSKLSESVADLVGVHGLDSKKADDSKHWQRSGPMTHEL